VRKLSALVLASLALSTLAAVACTQVEPSNKMNFTDDDDEDKDKPRQTQPPTSELPPGADPPLPDGGKPPGRVFAHTKSTLYRFDPLANTLTEVGPFSCVPRDESKAPGSLENDAVIDLALDRNGNMYATTFWRFIKVDATSGSCTVVRTDPTANQYPNSLSFVPRGSNEVLVGYAFDATSAARIFTEIDLTTGEMTDTGDLNPDEPLAEGEFGMSGDFISLVRTNGKTYAAVKSLTTTDGNDFLAEIDTTNGNIKAIIGDTGQKGFFGLGFWAGKAYGFTESGKIYEVDVTNGSSKLTLEGKDSNGIALVWYGAGVTTDAPTAP
jgi:hypothetical protein